MFGQQLSCCRRVGKRDRWHIVRWPTLWRLIVVAVVIVGHDCGGREGGGLCVRGQRVRIAVRTGHENAVKSGSAKMGLLVK